MSANGVIVPYLRVSTLGQDTGLEIQWEKIQKWAEFQGLELLLELELVYQDKLSGAGGADDRPGLKAALRAALQAAEDARQRQASPPVLVVYKLDRLGRNAVDVQEALAVLLDAGVRVVALADGIDSASGMGAALLKLLVSILSTFAELERETIRTRLLDGRRRADQANKPYASEPRYGRRVGEDGQLHEDAGELAAVEMIRKLRGEGKSVRAICSALVDAGHRPRRGATWSTSVVHRIAKGTRREKKTAKRGRIERARQELLRE
jgi:site-specific DNA recombinase